MAEEQNRIRRLHIGGREAHDNWEILNAVASEHVDHLGDAIDLSRFPDETFAEVYASHVLEHFDFNGPLNCALKEWRRVLQPGGSLYVSVPDLERVCLLYITPRLAPEIRHEIMQIIYGSHRGKFDYHLTGFDFDFLVRVLRDAGFAAVRRVVSFNLFRDTSETQFLGMPISLNVIATR